MAYPIINESLSEGGTCGFGEEGKIRDNLTDGGRLDVRGRWERTLSGR